MSNYVYIATSLDGYIARSDGSIDWLTGIENSEKTDYGYQEFISKIDAIVMGRKTYQFVEKLKPWPYTVPVFVLSSTLLPSEDKKNKVKIVHADPKELVADLHQQKLTNLYIDGGKTIQSFLDQDLIDEIIITRIPRLLGSGIPLFANRKKERKLRHIESVIYRNGLVKSAYKFIK